MLYFLGVIEIFAKGCLEDFDIYSRKSIKLEFVDFSIGPILLTASIPQCLFWFSFFINLFYFRRKQIHLYVVCPIIFLNICFTT